MIICLLINEKKQSVAENSISGRYPINTLIRVLPIDEE
jgi:hypothetical protein